MNVTLVGFMPDGARREFRVKGGRFLIGRKPDCDLCVPHATVSRQHCEIVVEGQAVILRDLGSSNGTFLNDVRVQESRLEPGDRVTVGPAALTVQVDGVPANIVPGAIPDPSDQSDADATSESVAVPDPQPEADKNDDSDLDSSDPLGSLISRQKKDDSSIFDFDFDLDDDKDD